MTSLTIDPIIEKKRASISGTASVGEHVNVTIKGVATLNTSTLYLRVMVGLRTIAQFPEPVEEGETQASWTVSGENLVCELNLNTVQAIKFCKCRDLDTLFVLEEIGDSSQTPERCPQLYFTREYSICGWPQKTPSDVPFDFDDYPSTLKLWMQQVANLAASVTKVGTVATISITDKNGTTTIATVSDGAKGDTGETGPQGNPGPKGDDGEKGDPGEGIPSGGTNGQVIKKDSSQVSGTKWEGISYSEVSGKPTINSVELSGNKTGSQLGLVEKVDGKGLSTEDFTTAEKTKLSGIESGAQRNVTPSWSSVTGKPSTFTPSNHNSSHFSNGEDPITPANIGAMSALDGTMSASGPYSITITDTYGTSVSELSEAFTETSGTRTYSGWKNGAIKLGRDTDGFVLFSTFEVEGGEWVIHLVNPSSISGNLPWTFDTMGGDSKHVVVSTASRTSSQLISQLSSAKSKSDSAYQKPSSGIPEFDLAQGVKDALVLARLSQEKYDTSKSAAENTGWDVIPVANSVKCVTSGGIKSALDNKQGTLVFDITPTSGSTNPVTSGGINDALDAKADGSANGVTFVDGDGRSGYGGIVYSGDGETQGQMDFSDTIERTSTLRPDGSDVQTANTVAAVLPYALSATETAPVTRTVITKVLAADATSDSYTLPAIDGDAATVQNCDIVVDARACTGDSIALTLTPTGTDIILYPNGNAPTLKKGTVTVIDCTSVKLGNDLVWLVMGATEMQAAS